MYTFVSGGKESNKAAEVFPAAVYLAVKNFSKRTYRSIKEIHVIVKDFDKLQDMVDTVNDLVARDRSLADQDTSQPGAVAPSTTPSPSEECTICTDEMKNPKALRCGHRFCSHCIDKWLKEKATCPCCVKVEGRRTGNQPPGKMSMCYFDSSLMGYEGYGHYGIQYLFLGGQQTVSKSVCQLE